jgi:hypothetical protein
MRRETKLPTWRPHEEETAAEITTDKVALKTLTADTKLRRSELADALTQEGFPIAPSTLASMGSRGNGPPYDLWGRIPIYGWGPSLRWAQNRLRRVGTL